MRENSSMTRQSLNQLRVSPLRLQQGLFASLALMVTLIGGQQLQHWQQSQQQIPQFERPVITLTSSELKANAPAATLESEKVCASASMEGHRSVAEMAYWQAKKGDA
jgi:hypothetical protein